MRYNTRYGSTRFFSSGYFPDGVKWLLISNVAIFVLTYLAAGTNFLAEVFPWLALRPDYVVHRLAIWQLVTYLFLHGGVLHLLFNMFTLWMFGITLEKEWGTRRFLKYYFVCGIGAGALRCDCERAARQLGHQHYRRFRRHLRLAAGVRRAIPRDDHPVHVAVSDQSEVFRDDIRGPGLVRRHATSTAASATSRTSAGWLFGFIYLKMHFPGWTSNEVRRWYRQYKLQRAKKKFQVYHAEARFRPGPWVN